jgi:mutator protein MutT
MNERVRGIIIEAGKIVLIERKSKDRTYYIFPGGGIEEGETTKEALTREMKEELGVDISIGDFFDDHQYSTPEGENIRHSFYLCKETGGVFGTGEGPEYQPGNAYQLDGTHDPVKIPLSELPNINLLPIKIKELVIEKFCR